MKFKAVAKTAIAQFDTFLSNVSKSRRSRHSIPAR